MDAYALFDALTDVRDGFLEETERRLHGKKRRRVGIYLLAAVLIVLLCFSSAVALDADFRQRVLSLFQVTEVANTFFNAVADGNQGGQNLEHGNIYKEDDMEIEIATVHAVKGETHAATLYLETFFNKYYESERLKEQFKGITYMGTDDDTLKSLRVVYVGMSRPRYLLCVAIQKDRFHTIDCQELRDIWDVVEA